MMVLQKTFHLQSYNRCPLPDFLSGVNSSSRGHELRDIGAIGLESDQWWLAEMWLAF